MRCAKRGRPTWARAGTGICLAQGTARRLCARNGFPAQDGFRQNWRFAGPPSNEHRRTVEVIFRADPNIYDGRYANVGWLQEVPKPVTNISWDNAALMSYRTLAQFGLAESDVVAIESNDNTVMAPVFAVPGHPMDGHALPWLWTPQRGPRRRRPGLQRLRDPQFQRFALRFRRDHEEDRPDL